MSKDLPPSGIDYQRQYDKGKKFRSDAFVYSVDEMTKTENNAQTIEGLSQGEMQCYATCITAWVVMQGVVPGADAQKYLTQIDRLAGNTGGGVSGAVDLSIIMNNLPFNEQQKGILRTKLRSTDVQAEWDSGEENIKGLRHGEILKEGGALVIQSPGHFCLAFIDDQARLVIFDPISGHIQQISKETLYDYATPETIGATKAAIVELPNLRAGSDEDFVMEQIR